MRIGKHIQHEVKHIQAGRQIEEYIAEHPADYLSRQRRAVAGERREEGETPRIGARIAGGSLGAIALGSAAVDGINHYVAALHIGLFGLRRSGREHRRSVAAQTAPCLLTGASQKHYTQQHTLLQNEHYNARNHKRCEPLLSVAQGIAHGTDRGVGAGGRHTQVRHRAIADIGIGGHLQFGHRRKESAVAQQQRHIHIKLHLRLTAAPQGGGIVVRYLDDSEALLLIHPLLGLLHVLGIAADLHRLGGVGVAHEFARRGRARVVDHGHRHLARDLGVVNQRINDRIGQRQGKEEYDDAYVVEHSRHLVAEDRGGLQQPSFNIGKHFSNHRR